LDRHDSILIGLYDEGIVWSLPGFGIIMTTDFFGNYPSFVILINSLLIKSTAQFGSSKLSFMGLLSPLLDLFFLVSVAS